MSQPELRTYEAFVCDAQRKLSFIRKCPVVVFEALQGDRLSLFAVVCFFINAIFWYVTSSFWQKFVIFVVTLLVIILFVDVLRCRAKELIIKQPALKTFWGSLVNAWVRHSTENDAETILTADVIIEKLSAVYASLLLMSVGLQNHQYFVPLAIGALCIAIIAISVWSFYILSLKMTVYWTAILLLFWPQFRRYNVLETLCSIIRFYREQLELSFSPGQRAQNHHSAQVDGDDDMFAIDDQLTGRAFGDALGEEFGSMAYEVDARPTESDGEDESRMIHRHDSLFGLGVDEMPSIAVGDDNSDDEWAFDAESPSLAEDMRFASGLDFPSLSQDSIDYHQTVRRRTHRQRPLQRSRLADLPEVSSPAVANSLRVAGEEAVRREMTSTPVFCTDDIDTKSLISSMIPQLETGLSTNGSGKPPGTRRKLPQLPQAQFSEHASPNTRETEDINTIYAQKGLHRHSSLTSSQLPSLQPEVTARIRSSATAPAAVLATDSLNDWNFQETSLAVGKSLTDKGKVDLSDFDVPDQAEIDSIRRSVEETEKPSYWFFGGNPQ